MVKEKQIVLFGKNIEGWAYQIIVAITRKGTFHAKGRIVYRAIKGFKGGYKGKTFFYKVRLPKGAVRHHVVYRDEDPNYGIIFCTKEHHAWLHGLGTVITRWK